MPEGDGEVGEESGIDEELVEKFWYQSFFS